MKICLYLEFYNFLNGILYKKIGTGLLSSYKNQQKIIKYLNVDCVEKYDNSCDVLIINTPWIRSLFLIRKARKNGKKVIIWSHVTAEDARDVFRFAKFFTPLLKKYLTYAYGLADVVLCPTQYTKGLLLGYSLPENKLVVQSNGVDLLKFQKDEEKRDLYRQKYELEKIVIGHVGLVIPRKGIKTFLKMAERFPENKFIWYGKIYNSLMVKALPETLPDNVKFTGYADDAVASFNSLDIFLFPSHEENQGMAIIEAAAIGLPILVRDIGAYEGWLIHDENCLKAKNDEEFNSYLDMLIKDDKLRRRLGENAKIMAENERNEKQAEKLNKIINELI